MTKFFAAAICLIAADGFAEDILDDTLKLIPETPPARATKKRTKPAAAAKKMTTDEAAEDLKMRIRFRDAKTKVFEDPQLQQQWDRAHAKKTEPERREALKAYYNTICDRVLKIDPTVKPKVDQLRNSLSWRLNPGVHGPAPVVKLPDPDDSMVIDTRND